MQQDRYEEQDCGDDCDGPGCRGVPVGMIDGKLAAQRERHEKRDYDPTVMESDRDTEDATELDMGFHVVVLRHKRHKKSKCVSRNIRVSRNSSINAIEVETPMRFRCCY